ncbi:MAG: UDP-N-acetylmuramoyl-tripeptide--D-alanyl-D-alanine ligase [Bacteroidota bacterium]
MDIAQLHSYFLENPKVSTDSRKIESGSIFFALKGPNFNGNAYAEQALEKGANYAVVDEVEFQTSERTLLVGNVLETLQQLATFHRRYLKLPIVALTGSNGKTTTKELIHAVLKKKYNTVATKGNLNNHIGVPLTLLSMNKDTEMGVVEMGANHQKEIAFLCSIAEPDFGYITNFGKAHLEGFGGVEGVIKGKSELYDYLLAHDKHVFFNADDAIQKDKLAAYIKKFGFSQNHSQFYRIKLIQKQPTLHIALEDIQIHSQLMGEYNFPNCCAAIIMGKYFNVPLSDIKAGIEAYLPDNNRSQLLKKGAHTLVMDAYNANPSSMKAALENFKAMNFEKTMLILGDMFELGEDTAKEHQVIADLAHSLGFDSVHLVGEHFSGANTSHPQYNSFEAFQEAFLPPVSETSWGILIKGSRGMALERILTSFESES